MLAAEFLLLAALWGASFLFLRWGVVDFGPLPTAFLRVALAALCLLPAFASPAIRRTWHHHWRRILLVGTINSAAPFALYALAVMHVPTGLAAIINALTPLAGATVAWLWLGERPDRSRLAGMAIGFAGVVALVAGSGGAGPGSPAGGVPLVGMLAGLGAAFCYGWGACYTRRHLRDAHPMALAAGSQLGASLLLALPAAWQWPATAPGAGAWAGIVALAVLCTALAYVLYFDIIARAGPARALTVTFLIPVFALLYGVLLLDEALTAHTLACGALIVAGTALACGLWPAAAARAATRPE
jgi:drug/metabolite transporter (DMT)-like permease